MGTIKETSEWVQPVYSIERTDPVMGGELGISNRQAAQLACRTLWLKNLLLSGHTEAGAHALTETDVADAAAIPENILALEYTTAQLHSLFAEQETSLASIQASLNNITGGRGTPLSALYHALLLSWLYGDQGYDFCLFTKEFSFDDAFTPTPIIEAVGRGDDSIDVEDTTFLLQGESYLLYNPSTGEQEEIVVKTVLTKNRFLAVNPVCIILDAGAHTGMLARSTWVVTDNTASAKSGTLFFTRYSSTVRNSALGRLTICASQQSRFRVRYRMRGELSWGAADLEGSESFDKNYMLFFYKFPGGGDVCFAVEAVSAAVINHMVVTISPEDIVPSHVRTPMGKGFFDVSRFGALYGATHECSEFQIATTSDFRAEVQTVQLDPLPVVGTVMHAGEALRPLLQLSGGRQYWWRVRYLSSKGHWSPWSMAETFVVRAS